APNITAHSLRCLCAINSDYGKRQNDRMLPFQHYLHETRSIHVRRDSRSSIAYSEELISATISATLQSTDRHHGIVGQERWHLQRDSCTRQAEPPEPGGSHWPFQKQCASPPPGNGSPRSLPGVVVVGN